MIADEQTRLEHPTRPSDSLVARQFRTNSEDPDLVRHSLRKVVHDYLTGGSIVLSQSPHARRRKKRLWDRRTAVRQVFRRPVWVHKAHRGDRFSNKSHSLLVDSQDQLYLVRDLSESGIGLTSDTLPTSRLVVLKFDSWHGLPVELLVQLRWRKRLGPQNYHCGGTIVGVLLPESKTR